MKNILKKIFSGAAAVIVLASCDMNLVPTTAIPYDDTKPLFNSLTDVQQFMNGVLSSYRAVQHGTFAESTEIMCDGFNATTGFGNNYGPIHRTDDTFTTGDDSPAGMWQSHYSVIKNYNIVLEGTQKEFPEDLALDVKLLRGITLFCRASSYLTLARHFGVVYNPESCEKDLCVPLVLRYNQYEKPKRASVYDVYDQIYADLTEAEMIFRNTMPGSIRSMYPTIDAVYALLARYYLDKQDYENAADYAMKVIKSEAGYALSETSRAMENEFLNDNGNEAVIQLYASLAEGKAFDTMYTLVNNDNEGKYFGSYYLPSQKLLDMYDSNDLRYKTWFSNKKYPVFMEGERYYGITVFVKYIGNPSLLLGVVETGAHAAKPIMISEMYLIAAEAYAMSNQPIKAKAILNELQKARLDISNAAEEAKLLTSGSMENIKKEWFKETVGEGHRFECLKRWGDGFDGRPAQTDAANAGIVMTGDHYEKKSIAADSHLWNWPIPSYETKINDALVQNDKY